MKTLLPILRAAAVRQIFDRPVFGTSSLGGAWSYSIRFDDSRHHVVSVEISPGSPETPAPAAEP